MISLILCIYLLVKVTKQENVIYNLHYENLILCSKLEDLQISIQKKKRTKKRV